VYPIRCKSQWQIRLRSLPVGPRLTLAWSNDPPDDGVPEAPTFAGWRVGSRRGRRLAGFETIRSGARPDLLHL
jgi:hypothetical protein